MPEHKIHHAPKKLGTEHRDQELARRKKPDQPDIVSFVPPEKGSIVNAAWQLEEAKPEANPKPVHKPEHKAHHKS